MTGVLIKGGKFRHRHTECENRDKGEQKKKAMYQQGRD